jgi:hypothetical protein
MREHVHYFQGFCRERENRGVAGGAEWIRTLSPGTGWALIEGMPKVLKPVAIYQSSVQNRAGAWLRGCAGRVDY